VSLVSDDLRLSVFGYYLDQGLSGHADGYNATRTRHGRVTVRELAEYTRKHVDRWAQHNQGTSQTPVLYGTGEDFAVVGYERGAIPPLGELPEAEPLPAWLRDLWVMHDRWYAAAVFRRAPRAYQQLGTFLLRAEERWRSGIEVDRIREELAQDLLRVKRLAEAAVDPPARTPRSLAMARGADRKADPAATEALRGLLEKVAPEANVKPEEVDKTRAAIKDKFKATPFVEVAAAVFETAVAEPAMTIKKVRLLQQVLDDWKGEPGYVETLYLQRLVDLAQTVEDKLWPWRVEAVQQLLRTVQEGEKVTACDPADVAWIEEAFQAADEKRRQAEKIFFTVRVPDPTWGQALTLLQEAERAYRAINADIDVLDRARQVRDEALALLPGYVPYLNRLGEGDPEEVRTWRSGVQAAVDLYEAMAKPDPTNLGVLDSRRSTVRGHLGSLRQAFQNRRKGFMELGEQATVADYPAFPALLSSPRLDARAREDLWQAGRKLARQLLTQTRQADEADAHEEQLPAGFAAGGGMDARAANGGGAARRAQLSIDLLKLGGLKQANDLQKALDRARNDPTEANWRALATSLYTAWTKDAPAQLEASGSDLPRADRLSLIADLLDQNRVATTGSRRWLANPAAAMRRQQVDHALEWLGRRYQAESQAAGANAVQRAFYAEAAEAYLR
jgi:hypothetical protein